MLPGHAQAKLDFRFAPGISPQEFAELLQAHLDRRGFDMVRGHQATGYAGAAAAPGRAGHPADRGPPHADRAGVPIVEWPISNNCVRGPAHRAARVHRLGGPLQHRGAGCGDRAHAPDEVLHVGVRASLMHWTVDFSRTGARVFASGTKSESPPH
jgi:acetylornithine deacetylase/succinyl-diaminopimelate desuccinylase-like protein